MKYFAMHFPISDKGSINTSRMCLEILTGPIALSVVFNFIMRYRFSIQFHYCKLYVLQIIIIMIIIMVIKKD